MSDQLYTLLANAKSLHEACQLEEAAEVYKSTLQIAQNLNQIPAELLDSYGDLANILCDTQLAASLFKESIQRYPGVNTSKYFSLAQLSSGKEAFELYKAGINILSQNLDEDGSRTQLATAYAAIAELHMSDLCDEEGAEEICENSLKAAIEADPSCIESYQALANLRLVRNRLDEARVAMNTVVETLEKAKADNLPSIEFILESMRNLIELQDFEAVLNVGDVGLGIDENNVEAIYMQAFAHCKLMNKRECFDLINLMGTKQLDREMRTAVEEVRQELLKLN